MVVRCLLFVWLLGLALAVLTDTCIAQPQPFGPPPKSIGRGGPPVPRPFNREDLFVRLNLGSQQRTRLIKLMDEYEVKMRELLTKLHKQRMDLISLYEQYQFDEKEAQRLIQGINQTQNELLKVHHDHHKRLRTILSKEQFAQWTQWWKEQVFPFGPGRRQRSEP